RALAHCGMKVHVVVGDHDQRGGGAWEPGNLKPENHIQHFGSINYSFLHKGVYFISYDCIFGNQEFEPSAWLVKELESLEKDRPIILLPHRPLTNVFFKTLKRFPIKACISGHWHSSRLFESEGIFHATCPSLSFGGIDFSPRSYRVFHWNGTELTCETFPLSKPASSGVNADPKVKINWSAPLGGKTVLGTPVISEKQIFVTSMEESGRGKGFLESFNLHSGAANWKAEVPASVKNSPALSGKNIIAVTVTGEVHSIDHSSGKINWTQSLGDPSERWVYCAPAVANGKVFVGSAGWFSALDAGTGKELWKLQLEKAQGWSDWISSPASPAVDASRVYVGFLWRNGSVAAAEQSTGKVIWKLDA
ncbi:MAG: PQQ-binding-like beta-propeller repeat protein, partial [Spirochaetia bacterium]|nr:PQQ-binding-like beta-propeller repeat protein [Spirochaetia bacterium]